MWDNSSSEVLSVLREDVGVYNVNIYEFIPLNYKQTYNLMNDYLYFKIKDEQD